MALSQPQTLGGRYEIRSRIGEGNFSVTWRATDMVLGRDVAIKVLREQYFAHAGFSSRFENEARAAALVNHPNVVQVYDYGRENDRAYIVMQYVPGPSLKEYMREEGPLTVEEAVEFTREMLDGLAAIHAAGIIHRDVKPQNALLTESRQIKLADFGIARLQDSGAGLTDAGTALGTAAYMAPEQASGQAITAATDLYSVGVMMYEMLTGRLPFLGENPVQVMYRHVNEMPVPPRTLNRQIPIAVEAFILRALAKDPADRFASARAMRDALLNPGAEATMAHARERLSDPDGATAVAPVVAAGSPPRPPVARRPVARDRDRERRRRRERLAWIIPLLVLLALLGVLGLVALAGQFGNNGGGSDDQNAPLIGGDDATSTVTAFPTSTATATATVTPSPEPTATIASPTATMTVTPTATASPTATPAPTETPIPPTETPPPPPTEAPPAPTVAFNEPLPLTGIPEAIAEGPSVTLDRDDFEGAYIRPDGMLYGLPAVHIYGQDSGAEAATATFDIDEAPSEYILITITGMDDENDEKVPVRILLNGNEVWSGPSPFPNEEWQDIGWLVSDLSWLREGENTLTFENVAPGGDIGTTPWNLISTATVYYR